MRREAASCGVSASTVWALPCSRILRTAPLAHDRMASLRVVTGAAEQSALKEVFMSTPMVCIEYEGRIHSPFTGQPAETEDGPNEADPSLLFVHYGNVGEYAYISPRLEEVLKEQLSEDTDPEELAGLVDLQGALVVRVDEGWNGVNHYGFAPAEE